MVTRVAVGAVLFAMALLGCEGAEFTALDGTHLLHPKYVAPTLPDESGDDAAPPDPTDAGSPPEAAPVNDGGFVGTPPPKPKDAGTTSPTPSCASTCAGCCDSTGACQTPTDTACGVAGGNCQDCTGSGAFCDHAGSCSIDTAEAGPTSGGSAADACASADAGSCAPEQIVCGAQETLTLECALTSTSCECWASTGSAAGHVRVSTLAGGLCQCPNLNDPTW